MSLLLALSLMATDATAVASLGDLGPEPDGQRMSPSEIRANNALLARNHPYYIRCQAHDETGSLVKKVRSCRTNHQWAEAWNVGNQNARDTIDAMSNKSTNTSN